LKIPPTDWFIPGSLLKINNFKFEDGDTRDKYMLVLWCDDTSATVLNVLTTSKMKRVTEESSLGCFIQHGIRFYFFPKNELISDGDFYFDKNTFIFWSNTVSESSVFDFEEYYSKPLIGMIKLCQLQPDIFKSVLECAVEASALEKKFKKLLKTFVESLT
jgi:hypothetical protein